MIRLNAIGHLGKDCEVRQVNGKQVINFSIGVTEKINNESKTKWIECAWWTKSDSVAKYLKKGQSVYVSGNPDVIMWSGDKGNGANLALFCLEVQLIGSNKKEPQNEPKPQNDEIDDLPF